jgi:hypothetical protein
VVRGGSWNNNRDNARCAYRNDNDPDNRNNNLGFRVLCVSHIEQSFAPASRHIGAGEAPKAFRKCRATTVVRPRRRICGWLRRVPSARIAQPSGAY